MKENNPPLCACGCGREVGPKKRQGRATGRPRLDAPPHEVKWNRVIRGHQKNRLGKCHSAEAIERMRQKKLGCPPWNKGKPTPAETREKQREAKLGKKRSPEAIAAMKRGQARAREKMSAGQKRRWSSLTPKQKSAAIKNCHRHSVRPTKPELAVKKLVELLGLPFEYNGHADGVRIDGLAPDFIRTDGVKDVILVHGCHWHKCYLCYPEKFDSMETEGILTDETERYRTEGFCPLVIWEHELKDADSVVGKLTCLAATA